MLIDLNASSKLAGIFDQVDQSLSLSIGQKMTIDPEAPDLFVKRLIHTCEFVKTTQSQFHFFQIFWTQIGEVDFPKKRVVEVFYNREKDLVEFSISETQDCIVHECLPFLKGNIWNSVGDAVMVSEGEPIDGLGPRILFVNDSFEKTTGYRLAEVVGKTPRILQGPNTSPEERQKIRTALKSWQPVRAELVNYRKDGIPFTVEIDITPVQDETGWWTHWVSVQRDVSMRKAREEVKKAANRTKTVEMMASGIAHDLNNRLAVINSTICLLEKKFAEPQKDLNSDRINSIFNDLHNRLLSCKSITHQFMNLSKRGSEVVEIKALDKEIIEAAELTIGSSGIKLIVQDQITDLPVTHIDFGLVTQIIQNLILNSMDALKENPPERENQISLTLTYSTENNLDGNWLRVFIADNGPGIKPHIAERLFSPFTTSKKTGNGLGLFTSQANMASMGGYLHLVRTSENGTAFEIGIPIDQKPVFEKSRQQLKSPCKLDRNLPLLLIEDNKDLAKLILENIRSSDLKAIHVETHEAAMENIHHQKFSLILSDINLSGRFNASQMIQKTLQIYPDQQIVLMTGSDPSLDINLKPVLEKHKDIKIMYKPFNDSEILSMY